MCDISFGKGNKRQEQRDFTLPESPSQSCKVGFTGGSGLVLEVPTDADTSFPIWDAIRSQHVDVAWEVTPHSISIYLTRQASTLVRAAGRHGRNASGATPTSACCSNFGQRPVVIQPIPHQYGAPQSNISTVLLAFPKPRPDLLQNLIPGTGLATIPLCTNVPGETPASTSSPNLGQCQAVIQPIPQQNGAPRSNPSTVPLTFPQTRPHLLQNLIPGTVPTIPLPRNASRATPASSCHSSFGQCQEVIQPIPQQNGAPRSNPSTVPLTFPQTRPRLMQNLIPRTVPTIPLPRNASGATPASACHSSFGQCQAVIQPIPQQNSAPRSNPSTVLLTFPQTCPSLLQNLIPAKVATIPCSLSHLPPSPQPTKKAALSFTSTPMSIHTNQWWTPWKEDNRRSFYNQNISQVHICDQFLLSMCDAGTSCSLHHKALPYYWQLFNYAIYQWVDMSIASQFQMERAYCDPTISYIYIKDGHNLYTLDLDILELEHSATQFSRVRRLTNTSDPAKNPFFPNKWRVYWWNKMAWQEYSEDLSEMLLVMMRRGEMEHRFEIDSQQYKVDLNTMIHTTVTTGYKTLVRCRPEYRPIASMMPYLKTEIMTWFTKTCVQSEDNFSIDPLEEFGSWYPPVWNLAFERDYSLVDVPTGTWAYYKIKTLFQQNLSQTAVEIVSIQQIQNLFHWDKFQSYKSYLLKHWREMAAPLERHLFHGTSESAVTDICHNNFDPRLAGTNGASLGHGTYFSISASYSHAYAIESAGSRIRHMFLAKVLVGNVCVGAPSYRRPPCLPLRGESHRFYNTCVNSVEKPTIFAVFDNSQCYPYYLMKYRVQH